MKNKWPKNYLSRSIDTWYYDHLINPYAGIDWQIDSTRLIVEAAKYGFILQSSCPNYIDNTEVKWYRSFENSKDLALNSKEFIFRNSLSIMFGGKIFFIGNNKMLIEFNTRITDLIKKMNYLEKKITRTKVIVFKNSLNKLYFFILQNKNLFFTNDIEKFLNGISLIENCIELCLNKKIDNLTDQLCKSEWFKNFWGSPVHYALFRKEENSLNVS